MAGNDAGWARGRFLLGRLGPAIAAVCLMGGARAGSDADIDAGSDQLQEVIVTAQRHEESLQKASLTIQC